jgi:hypothetical protein
MLSVVFLYCFTECHVFCCYAECNYSEGAGARKLTGENLKTGLGRAFNCKLGCYDDVHVIMYTDAHPYL